MNRFAPPQRFAQQKLVDVVPIQPPPVEQRVQRQSDFASSEAKETRYTLPPSLQSASPVGFRHRLPLNRSEAEEMLQLLALERPEEFVPSTHPVREEELFEESALGIMSARQSTNFRGHRQVTVGPYDSERAAEILRDAAGLDAPVLDNAQYTHLVFSRPYRTLFTMLLTLIGHRPVVSLITVAIRALRKRFQHIDDIPTIGYLQHLHLGILADALERAVVVASKGRRAAQVFMKPFCGEWQRRNRHRVRQLEDLAGLTSQERRQGWKLALVAQVGAVEEARKPPIRTETYRKIGANLIAFRSERIQPGINQEDKAPAQYHRRQDMDVPDELTVQCGRAAYNAFVHWTGVDRERSKALLLLERIDVLTPNGKQRLREVRDMLNTVSENVMSSLPLWADLPTGRALSRNAARGKKAFALAGQRIYIGGLDRREIREEGLDWFHAIRAFGAAAARAALVAEIAGCVDLPRDCDLLAGICLMAGPVNQNDIGKTFYGQPDMLASAFPDHEPTSLLVWTLKAKTIADPIGNEEQLMNAARKGALVDLRPGPHEVVTLKRAGKFAPLRQHAGRVNTERAFSEMDNFVVSPSGKPIPGNRGSRWPDAWRDEALW